jgi:hypothetical protein
MSDLQKFVGTWRSERGAPYSTQTFTWVVADDGLHGQWVIEAAVPPPGERTWMSDPKPMRLEMQIGTPIAEQERVLFTANGGPYLSEFRLAGNDEAVVGAAPDKIPAEFAGPEFARSIEGHRIRLRRV